jgi:phage gpG-like protein
MVFKMSLTTPKVKENWWASSKTELNKIVEDYNRQNWAQQRDPVSLKPWTPRKPPTGTWPILRKTGKMQDTARFKTTSAPMIFIARVEDYGTFHQYGTSRMPQRRWLGIGEQIINPMEKVIAKHIFKGKIRSTFSI